MSRQTNTLPLSPDELGLLESERIRQEIREWNKTRNTDWIPAMRADEFGGYFPTHEMGEKELRIR
jgi:hypothetical protein